MIPYNVIYRDFPESEAVTTVIEKYVQKIEKFGSGRILSCNVVVSAPHRHHNKGKIYHIEIRMHVGNKDIIVNQEPETNHAHEDIHVAIRDSFAAAERQIKSYVEKNQP